MDEPFGLYVHLPWCVRKCPYCDFNSHALKDTLDERGYVRALLEDVDLQQPAFEGRLLASIFIGGGTPSLFSPDAIHALLEGIGQRLTLAVDCEITLEANPGTVEQARFSGYRQAGVNRLSLGLQSFNGRHLEQLGRIHDGDQARKALDAAFKAGFSRVNGDLMFGLPHQSLNQALDDVNTLLQWPVEHVSLYQLTLEPNTLFAHQPPKGLPEHDALADMHDALIRHLQQAGFQRYEISAFARDGGACRHNLNYWCFGDYLGIGAGAHGKHSRSEPLRTRRPRHPRAYLDTVAAGLPAVTESIPASQLPFEFMLNALRLVDGVAEPRFHQTTGLPLSRIQPLLETLRAEGLLRNGRLACTALGLRFLDSITARFLP